MKPERIQEPFADLPSWRHRQSSFLSRSFEFADYRAVLEFLIALCEFTRNARQQPWIQVRGTQVEVRMIVPEDGIDDRLAEYVRSVEALPELTPMLPRRSQA